MDDGAYGAIWLFLFEGGAEASGAGVAMEVEGPRRVDDRVPVRKNKHRGDGEFREKSANCIFYCGGEFERGALFQEGRHRAYVVSHVGQELAVITKTAKTAKLFDIRRHRHACEGGDAIVVGAYAICRDDVTQKVNTCGTNPGFIRGELEFMKA